MARKRKKRSSSAQQVSTWSRLQDYFISESFAGFNRRLVRIVLLLAVMAAVGVGFTYLDRYVHRITEQREVELTVSLVNPPAWATADLIKDICLSSGLRRDDFILDEKLTARWFANLAANPWVKHIRQIRKRYDGRIEIDCELRQPIAVISKGVHKRYVDTDGVILPAAPLVPGHCHLVEMRDRVDVRALPDVGEPLASKALISGLELLSMVRRMDAELDDGPPLLPELAVLDVSNFEGQINQGSFAPDALHPKQHRGALGRCPGSLGTLQRSTLPSEIGNPLHNPSSARFRRPLTIRRTPRSPQTPRLAKQYYRRVKSRSISPVSDNVVNHYVAANVAWSGTAAASGSSSRGRVFQRRCIHQYCSGSARTNDSIAAVHCAVIHSTGSDLSCHSCG